MAEEIKSHGLLKGKKGIVFGPLDESSIGWSIARAAYREGSTLAISNIPISQRIGKIDHLCKLCGDALLILCDATKEDELLDAFSTVKERLGKIDFIVHSIGMSQNIRKDIPYDDINYQWYARTMDVSAISLHKIISASLKKDAINSGSSIVSLTYIASSRNFWQYSDMGDAKSLLESISRSYGPRLAKKGIRINTVSQSPTYTKAGSGIKTFDLMYNYSNLLSPLGNASAEECADYVTTILSDLTKKVTMQTLFHDGGYSAMGATYPILQALQKVLDEPELAKDIDFQEFFPPHMKKDDIFKGKKKQEKS